MLAACISTTIQKLHPNLFSLNTVFIMSGTKPVWPTYSWRAKSANTRLVYIRDHQQADLEVLSLRSPLGFDLEWRPNFVKGQLQNPVALVQLSDEDTILLIQITAMSGMVFFHILRFVCVAERIFRISKQAHRAP